MSRSFFIAFYLFGFCSLAISQTVDTLYFDKSWHPCKKQKAKYYRLMQQLDGIYQIQDFYKTGVLQMKASAISLEPEVFDGPCTYYYSNGNRELTGVYNKGKRIGTWTYYNSKGRAIGSEDHNRVAGKGIGGSIDSANIPKRAYKKAISESDNKFSIALRGKLFGFVIIEDNYFSTTTIGAEFLMKGRHSLGVDFTFFGWQYEHDDSKDNPLYETYERRTYLYLDYKYKFLAFRSFDFYVNVYDKIGTYHMWKEGISEGYNFWEKPYLNNKVDGTFNQIGAGLGFKKYVTEKFYVDLSVNGGKLFSKNNTITYKDSLSNADIRYNVKEDKSIFYMRLNLGYKLFIKKDKEVFYQD